MIPMLGLDLLPRTHGILQHGIDKGLQVGAQLFLGRAAGTLADFALGEARPGVAMRPDTMMIWMSACKPVAAVGIAQLWEQGRLDLDDRVARHIAEFASRGKEDVTI